MIKENITGFEAMYIAEKDPEKMELKHSSFTDWHEYKWWIGSSNIGIFYGKNWSVRTKQTKLEKVMEEITENISSQVSKHNPSVRILDLKDLKPILEKYIKE